jgi:hypothetical protein
MVPRAPPHQGMLRPQQGWGLGLPRLRGRLRGRRAVNRRPSRRRRSPQAPPPSRRLRLLSGLPREAVQITVGGWTTTAMSPTTTAPQATSMPCVALQRQSWPPACAKAHPTSGSNRAGANPVLQGHDHWWRRHSQLRLQLVNGLPMRPVEGRIPARQRLGRRGWVSAPNADGWREILHRQHTGPAATSAELRSGQMQPQQPRKIPAELLGRCFNCMSYPHLVATCRLPWRCLRCCGLHHLTRDCRCLRHAATSQRASHCPPSAERAVLSTVAGVGGNCRRRQQCRSKPARSSRVINATPAVDAGCFPELDPLGLEPCASSVPPTWIYPMLEEFAASHREARALSDTYSPATDPPPSSPMQGTTPQMGLAVVADEVAPAVVAPTSTRDCGQATPDPSTPMKDGLLDSHATSDLSDVTPTPGEAARRLARFVAEVRVKRASPLIATPPRQKTATARPQPIRSRRIATQPLAHIPTARWGEVLMQRMGIAPPATPVSTTSKATYDAVFTGNLSSSQVEALDELFPAANCKAARTLFAEGP